VAVVLRFHGRKHNHSADEIMAEIVAMRLVQHLECAGFVVMKRPPEIDGAALGRAFEDSGCGTAAATTQSNSDLISE
jgi:hypothetical protein